MLSEVRHCKALFRIGLYLPCVISGVAASFLFKSLYSPEPYSVLNTILTNLGLPTSRFTSDPKLAIPLIVVARTWRGAGGTILIYLSAIQTIDTNQFEAVRLDGGGFISRLNHVVLAHLKPTISTLFIRQIISVFQVFYEPMIITSTNNPNTISLMLKSYTYALRMENQNWVQLSVLFFPSSSFYLLACTSLSNGSLTPERRKQDEKS